jgi:hypothetical protein
MTGAFTAMLSAVQELITSLTTGEKAGFSGSQILLFVFSATGPHRIRLAAIASLFDLNLARGTLSGMTGRLTMMTSTIERFLAFVTATLSIVVETTSQAVRGTTAPAVTKGSHGSARRARARVALERAGVGTGRAGARTKAKIAARMWHLHGIVRWLLDLAAETPRVGHAILAMAALGTMPTQGSVRSGVWIARRFCPLFGAENVQNAITMTARPSRHTWNNHIKTDIALVTVTDELLDDF